MTNQDVVQAWIGHRRGHSDNMSTDGVHLYSYALPIGVWRNKVPIVYNYTATAHGGAEARGFVSMTTSHHVGLAYHGVGSWRAKRTHVILDTQ